MARDGGRHTPEGVSSRFASDHEHSIWGVSLVCGAVETLQMRCRSALCRSRDRSGRSRHRGRRSRDRSGRSRHRGRRSRDRPGRSRHRGRRSRGHWSTDRADSQRQDGHPVCRRLFRPDSRFGWPMAPCWLPAPAGGWPAARLRRSGPPNRRSFAPRQRPFSDGSVRREKRRPRSATTAAWFAELSRSRQCPETRLSSSNPGRLERSGTTTISMRRLAARPSEVSLGRAGLLSP